MTGQEHIRLRKSVRGLTQAELAKRLNVAVTTINRRERGGTIKPEAELALRQIVREELAAGRGAIGQDSPYMDEVAVLVQTESPTIESWRKLEQIVQRSGRSIESGY